MLCSQCGYESGNGAEFCVKCGEPCVNLTRRHPKKVFVVASIMVALALIIFAISFVYSKTSVAKVNGNSTAKAKGDWIAKVNGENVSVDDYNKRLAQTKKTYEQQGVDLSTEQGKQTLDAITKQIIDDLVTELLILQEAKNQHLMDDEKVQIEVQKIKSSYVTVDGKPDEAAFQEWLKGQEMTEEELIAYIKTTLAIQAVLAQVTSGIAVSDADVQKYYEQNKESFSDSEKVKARHILVRSEAEAITVIAQLNSGANFTELAKEKSTAQGAKESGGDLGYLSKGEFVPEFEKAAFEQKVGTYFQLPVKTPFGFHVILVEDHKPKLQKTFDQVSEQIKQTLLRAKKEQKSKEYLDGLKTKATIEYALDHVK